MAFFYGFTFTLPHLHPFRPLEKRKMEKVSFQWTESCPARYILTTRRVDRTKAAAAPLVLSGWRIKSDTFKRRQLAALKRGIVVGLEQLEQGPYCTYNDTNVMQLAKDVSRSGEPRLREARANGTRLTGKIPHRSE